jgi:hypothetical protein
VGILRFAVEIQVGSHMTHFLSNASIYRAIAEEANEEAQRLWNESRTPKPDGSAGFIVAFDPSRRSFKKSLVAIAFAGIYLEALLYLKGTQTMGKTWKNKWDGSTYEEKLRVLGVNDAQFLASAERLRKSRRDLVHEKAVPLEDIAIAELRWAHEEAAFAAAFIGQVNERLYGMA